MPDTTVPEIPVTEPTPTSAPTTPPAPERKMWFGGSLAITTSNREAIMGVLDTIFMATQPTYLLEVQPKGEIMIALNDPMISLLKPAQIDYTVPRYFSSDWEPERNLSSDRLQSDTFTFSGTLKRMKGDPIELKETHKKITDTLWLVETD